MIKQNFAIQKSSATRNENIRLLIVNAGSSSIKFAFYNDESGELSRTDSGEIAGIGNRQITFRQNKLSEELSFEARDFQSAVVFLLNKIQLNPHYLNLSAIGHRIVHGMQRSAPTKVDKQLLNELKEIIPYDPEHLPPEINLIEAFQNVNPNLPQYVCFDTHFHQNMPDLARMLAIPAHFTAKGLHRYGFHGLSYQYLLNTLQKQGIKEARTGRIIFAHLGSGASLAAVFNGQSIDTTMGFTPASGLPMSTRTGDLDPGAAWFMLQSEKLSPSEFNHLVNHKSGLLGISETTGDMSQLLLQEHADTRSADAINFFCYQIKKSIGALSAVLGGLDMLVFTGGVGENSAIIRARICSGMDYLGISLDQKLNTNNQYCISAKEAIPILVIKTDEERMIAEIVSNIISTYKT